MSIHFSVVTPCYNAMPWIKPCVASVADQEGVSVQHVVQDGGSKDGTAEYLLAEPRIEAESKPDKGMYDAINQAWAKCRGDFVVHINADEELLPGALKLVGEYFQAHPTVDVVLCGTLVCNADGSLDTYRKAIRPTISFMTTNHHPVLSCGIFLRRSSFAKRPWLYDPGFRIISDVLLMIDIVRDGMNIAVLDHYTSIFFLTGTNMGFNNSPKTLAEFEYKNSLATPWQRRARLAIRALHLLRKLMQGHYGQGALAYDLYLPGKEEMRTHIVVAKPNGVYRPPRTRDVHS